MRNGVVQESQTYQTRIVAIDPTKIGEFIENIDSSRDLPLEDWNISLDSSSQDVQKLMKAGDRLRHSDVPVAFPTETVYGLGADATRGAAVKGIYRAKQRPSDNPLIVHIASIKQLRDLLTSDADGQGELANGHIKDPIPEIYKPLIRKFWPGPLTIILPNPTNSRLAPEVTAGLDTFGARMPRNLLALALIKLANVPVAAPSANASTKPSPTAAEHVLNDLDGRIEMIVDGGPCNVGVESTVVDGLSTPPAILRPGGISLAQLRACPGWEGTVLGYKDSSEKGSKPKAPGMKYRHYSPKAKVLLFEAGSKVPMVEDLEAQLGSRRRLGVVRTRKWGRIRGDGVFDKIPESGGGENSSSLASHDVATAASEPVNGSSEPTPLRHMLSELHTYRQAQPEKVEVQAGDSLRGYKVTMFEVWDMHLGRSTSDIARGLFSALRDLDRLDVDAILVEGIDDGDGDRDGGGGGGGGDDDVAAAVMNRLRKAAEIHINHQP